MMAFEEILSRFPGTRKPNGRGGFLVNCSLGHDSKTPSLSITPANGAGPAFHCFGCGADRKDIIEAAGMTLADILPPKETARSTPSPAAASPISTPKQKTPPGTLTRYKIRDAFGNLIAIHVREDLPDGKKVWWERPDGTRGLGGLKLANLPLYGIDRIAVDAKEIIIVEGEKAADALHVNGIPAVGTVTGASGTPGNGALRPLLSASKVYLWPDNDAVGLQHMGRIGAALLRLRQDDVRLIDWRTAPDKGDAADLFALESAMDEFQELMEEAQPFEGAREDLLGEKADATSAAGTVKQDAKPRIYAGNGDLAAISAEAWAAVVRGNVPEQSFIFAGEPMRIEDGDGECPILRPLTPDRLRGISARVADWFRIDKYGNSKPAHPPMAMIRDMLAQPGIPLPPLSAIIEAPIVAPDGSIPTAPGYNPATRTYYAPAKGFYVPPVSPDPTAPERARARAFILDELLGDFPFTGPPEKANAVAVLFHPFARLLFSGPSPLHLVEKPTPGTGATLLVDVLTYPATGRNIAAMSEGRDEDEWRKRILALLRKAPHFALIDNLRGRLDSAAVSSVLTSTFWEDRKLGVSEMIRVPNRCAWIATGNNPALSSEISRRTVRTRLDAKQDRPWQRESVDFRHPNLRAWAADNRADIVWAALTLVRAWLAAGRPNAHNLPTLGMYEDWARVIGGILYHAGVLGFLGNLTALYEDSDSEGRETRTFLAAWWEKHRETAVGVAALWEIASSPDSTLPLGDKGDRSQRTRLGRLLGQLRDRRYQLEEGQFVTVTSAGEIRNAAQWRLKI